MADQLRRIYMDNAATTPVLPEIAQTMAEVMVEGFGNPSSVHKFGRDAKKLMEQARGQVAQALNAEPNEIFFTGSGTEADNWAIRGVMAANQSKGKKIITSAFEHHAILHTFQYMEKNGCSVIYLPVDSDGVVSMEALEQAVDDDTALVSIMFANNEIGTIQPIERIGKLCRERQVLFHTDAVQAVGSVPVDVKAMNIDLLSLSAHKLYGPKGVGALYVRKGVRIQPLIHGGAQEGNRRAGTENVAGIVGLGMAVERSQQDMTQKSAELTGLRDALIDGILTRIPDVRLNGHRTQRLPGNVNVSFQYVEGESLLLSLDLKGIAGSSGSACTSGSLDPSHVLLAIGLNHETAHGSLRLSLGRMNTMKDVEDCIAALEEILPRLRAMSPLFNQEKGGRHYV